MLHWPWVTAIHGYLLQKSLPSNEKGMFFIGGTFAMAIQIGINGFGRIGRVAFRIAIDKPEEFHLCGINVRNANLEYMVYMIRYDSIFGRFQGTLDTYENGIVVNGQKIPVYSESDASLIPWGGVRSRVHHRRHRRFLHHRKGHGAHPGRRKESDRNGAGQGRCDSHLCYGHQP